MIFNLLKNQKKPSPLFIKSMIKSQEIRSGAGIVVIPPKKAPIRFSIPLEVKTTERAELQSFYLALGKLPEKSCVCLFHTDYFWEFFSQFSP